MAFFTGEHECKLDAKGRLVLPSRLKSVLPEASKKNMIIRKGFEPNFIHLMNFKIFTQELAH